MSQKYGSLSNYVEEGIGNSQKIEVGMGVTYLSWTDRHALTIISVSKSGKSFIAQKDKATRVDENGQSECQTYEYEADPNGAKYQYRKAKNGKFYTKGGMENGNGCIIGHRDEYYDYSF